MTLILNSHTKKKQLAESLDTTLENLKKEISEVAERKHAPKGGLTNDQNISKLNDDMVQLREQVVRLSQLATAAIKITQQIVKMEKK